METRDASLGAGPPRRARAGPDPGRLTAALLLVFGLAAALSIDVVEDGFGVKGDEATYVSMALSLAADGNLSLERRDLDRYWRRYQTGPQGIFLKRGRRLRVEASAAWPFVRVRSLPDDRDDRLFYGKAFIYPLAAAPFVWLFDLNGLLVLHALLFAGVFYAGYRFLAPRASPGPALLFALAFVTVSITPIYVLWLTPEIFNFSLVFFAYFLWLYKEAVPLAAGERPGWVRSPASDYAAIVLLGLVTYSKPTNLLLAAPPVLLLWWRRRWWAGWLLGAAFAAVVAASFGANALVSGELNYQGGARKVFYEYFPFEHPGATFDNLGISMATDELALDEILDPEGYWAVLGHNLVYFFVGRHFGFLPFFFPGVVAGVLFLRSRREHAAWHYLVLAAVGATAIGLLFWIPYSWSGGGGPPGNRYFLSIYPAIFFLTPALASIRPALLAWLGGALFMAPLLVNPFVAARDTYRNTQRGLFRLLPVELTMVNDLPIMLYSPRARIVYGDPAVLLYLLDENTFLPEPAGIWVAGESRADIIVRTDRPLATITLTLDSPIANTVSVRVGRARRTVALEPAVPVSVTLEPDGVYARRSHAYLLSVTSETGFVPRLLAPPSDDSRYLGVLIARLASQVR